MIQAYSSICLTPVSLYIKKYSFILQNGSLPFRDDDGLHVCRLTLQEVPS